MKKTALISVYDKIGIIEFARELEELGWEIIASGGTYKTLKSAKIKAIPIEKITGNPEILEGRVKTISYQVAAGILFDRSKRNHQKEINELKIPCIDMVICNLYPFEKTVFKRNFLSDTLEMIDIGGVTLLRAAAKNYKFVTALMDPKDYPSILEELEKQGEVTIETRKKLASKVFWKISDYDNAIDIYLAKQLTGEAVLKLSFCKGRKLRYGENPHLQGWFYKEAARDPLAIQNFEKLQGRELSFNNYLDISSVIDALSEMGGEKPVCVIVKHNSPAGGALADTVEKAYENAWEGGDPLASFGGIIGVNREIDKKLATKMTSNKKFFEVVIAPKISKEAQEVFSSRKKLITLINNTLKNPKMKRRKEFKKIRGGTLEQDFDSKQISEKDLKVVTSKKPTKKQIKDLLFAWKMVKVSKSNAVTIVKNQALISSGVGQQDRKESCRIAIYKATDKDRGKYKNTPNGSVAASDAFFPFPDGPEILIKAGIKAIIQPGGSIRDQETINICNKHKVAMVFTGIRAFKH